jgi:hypothetical protein
VIVSGNVLGDLWDWVVGVVEQIGDVSVYWLALALALKTAESAFIGLGWRNILRVAYPQSGLRSRRRARHRREGRRSTRWRRRRRGSLP